MASIRHFLWPSGKRKALTMSYDDGQIHDRKLVDIFNQNGIRGTFHLNSSRLDRENIIRSDEVATLFSGHEVAAHSVTHPFLPYIPDEAIVKEIMEDRHALEQLVGYPVRGFSYPSGAFDDRVVEALKHLGIAYARTTRNDGGFKPPEDPLRWGATCHHRNKLIETGQSYLDAPPKHSLLMYVWGHSYEFDRNDNWELIEEFCALMGKNEDLWYATNIEIINYLTAVNRLLCSADCTCIQNPSAQSVWLQINGKTEELKPGQITRIEET